MGLAYPVPVIDLHEKRVAAFSQGHVLQFAMIPTIPIAPQHQA